MTNSSFLVLGLVDLMEPTTPYDLEGVIQRSGMTSFWWLSHTQLSSACARLAAGGYLSEEREETGRRRRLFRLTDAGHEAIDTWRAEPPEKAEQTRDPALLKLFFGGDGAIIAAAQVDLHRRQLATYQDLVAKVGEGRYGGRGLILAYGLAFERMALDLWTRLASAGHSAG
ncbi:MAG TPA: helix-turn-helix transcriptional regulator [Acidimicrobiales bacterium]|nr:helix-turn-helix transcriptional regulator [Acidimicrobiales bacterium]